MKKLKSILFSAVILSLVVFVSSCDPHKPPHLVFKTDAGYLSADATVAKGSTVKVGVIADKTEDDMKRYNISYAFDGATATSTKESFNLSGSEENHYEKDYEFTVRNQAGTETWYFVITDKDGNIAKLSVVLTVN